MSKIFAALTPLLLIAMLSIVSPLGADDNEKTSAPTDKAAIVPSEFKDSAKISRLLREREEILLKMHEIRVKLIAEDPQLKKLHRQIMSLHKEMAIELDSRKEMKLQTSRLRELDSEIDKMPRKGSE